MFTWALMFLVIAIASLPFGLIAEPYSAEGVIAWSFFIAGIIFAVLFSLAANLPRKR